MFASGCKISYVVALEGKGTYNIWSLLGSGYL